LLEIGLLNEGSTAECGSVGRPVLPLSVNAGWSRFVGVKLTDERSYAVLTDLSGSVIRGIDAPLPGREQADVLALIVAQVNDLAGNVHGPACNRGHRGCVSGYATTSAILAAVRERSGTAADLSAVAAMAREGDRLARSVLTEAGHAMGCLIGTIANVTGPEQIVLSGEGAELFEILDTALHQGIAEVIHPSVPPITLVVKQLPFSEWARGAAMVAIDDHLARRTQKPLSTSWM
jgi:predicted NBD/HSP70 family sugar kinase